MFLGSGYGQVWGAARQAKRASPIVAVELPEAVARELRLAAVPEDGFDET